MRPFDSSHRGLQDNRIICPKRTQIDRQRTILNFFLWFKKITKISQNADFWSKLPMRDYKIRTSPSH